MVSKLELCQVARVTKQKSGNLGTMAGIGRRWRKDPVSKDGIMVMAGILLCLLSPYLTLGKSQGCVEWTRIQLSAWVPALLIRNCDILPERA